MLDHIGTKRISIRRTQDGIGIRRLGAEPEHLELDGDEWLDLVALVLAIKASSDFLEGR